MLDFNNRESIAATSLGSDVAEKPLSSLNLCPGSDRQQQRVIKDHGGVGLIFNNPRNARFASCQGAGPCSSIHGTARCVVVPSKAI